MFMDSVRDEIAKNMLYYRKKKGTTQKEIANYLGVKNSAVSNWEKGVNSIDIDTLHKACIFFNVSISDMFGAYSNSNKSLSKEESILLDNFNTLNKEGKEKLIDYADDLISSKKYIQCGKNRMDKKVG